MEKREKLSLNLDELLLEDAKKHLEEYGKRCKECGSEDYSEINCDVDELVVNLVEEIVNFLRSHDMPSVYTKAAEIVGLGRKTVYRYLNS